MKSPAGERRGGGVRFSLFITGDFQSLAQKPTEPDCTLRPKICDRCLGACLGSAASVCLTCPLFPHSLLKLGLRRNPCLGGRPGRLEAPYGRIGWQAALFLAWLKPHQFGRGRATCLGEDKKKSLAGGVQRASESSESSVLNSQWPTRVVLQRCSRLGRKGCREGSRDISEILGVWDCHSLETGLSYQNGRFQMPFLECNGSFRYSPPFLFLMF